MVDLIAPTVSLVVAKKLAPYYPQEQFPQMVWVQRTPRERWFLAFSDGMASNIVSADPRCIFYNARLLYAHQWYAAPTQLQALALLEQEHGYAWNRIYEENLEPCWVAWLANDMPYISTTNPDSLLLEILKHMEKKDGKA